MAKITMEELRNRIRSLADKTPSPEERAELEGYLTHKRQDIQSLAAQVLGTWGDRRSVGLLHGLLVRAYDRENWGTTHMVAIKALRRCVTAEDADWIMDLLFQVPGALAKHILIPLALALPPESIRERLVAASADADALNRAAALRVIFNLTVSPARRRELLSLFVDDPEPRYRRSARLWVQRLREHEDDQQGGQSA